jgi:pimeloyl-ACP methyl ester carboxylesterase
VIRGVGEYPFELVIPARAATDGPFPLLVYGHGLLGGAEEISGRHVRSLCNDKGYLCIGTDWIGLSESEAAGVGANAAALSAIKDLNRFSWVGDRLQQALVNFMVLTRTARRIAQDPQARVAVGAGAPESALAEPFEAVYYGISQGGIMGTSLVAYSPDIEKGVVQVGGSAYSLMIQRSVNWNEFYPAIFNAYPDRIDQQLVMALWQPMFDFSEGSGTAWAQGVHDPLPGTSKKHLLLQIAVGDSQVANLAAEIQARTLGLGLLAPSAKPVWGLEPVSEGADAALVAWDLERTPPPDTNATPPTDNDVHGDVRFLPENQEQTDAFLKTGKVKNTCGGPCSFPDFVP